MPKAKKATGRQASTEARASQSGVPAAKGRAKSTTAIDPPSTEATCSQRPPGTRIRPARLTSQAKIASEPIS